MVWPITGAKSYVCETGKSMKAVEMAVAQEGSWRKIAIAPTADWDSVGLAVMLA
jgi:hypothetical protein